MQARLSELIEAQDLNGLLRAVDALCERRAWDDLLEVADKCEAALERGKQLWPITQHIDYRLALEGPAELAAMVISQQTPRFTLGPLTEVAASTHTWDELVSHIEQPQVAAYVAQERVLRGEVLVGDDRAHPEMLDLPLRVEAWEPQYALATFKSNHVEVAEPWEPRVPAAQRQRRPAAELDEPELTNALLDLVHSWTAESNGAARAVVVDGDAIGACSALTYSGLRVGELALDEALRLMGWAASSGGAHGRRRGTAYGRFLCWYTSSLLAEVEWPPEPDELGRALQTLHWYHWDEGDREQGWVLRVAVEDPSAGWAAALGATDLLETEQL